MPQRLMHMHMGQTQPQAQREGEGGAEAGAGVLHVCSVPDKVSIMRRPTASTCHTNQIKQKKPSRSCRQLAAGNGNSVLHLLAEWWQVLDRIPQNRTRDNTPSHYILLNPLSSSRTCRTNVHNYVHLASCRAATATKCCFQQQRPQLHLC